MAKPDSFFKTVKRFFSDYVAALSTRGAFGQLVLQAQQDDKLRARLIESPRQVLEEAGIRLPAQLKIKFVQNTDTQLHIVLPPLVKDAE